MADGTRNGMEESNSCTIACSSMLDKRDRDQGAVSVVNGWPPAELMKSSDERLFAYGGDGERAGAYGWRRDSSLLFT